MGDFWEHFALTPTISDYQLSWGMRMAPGRGLGHLCW